MLPELCLLPSENDQLVKSRFWEVARRSAAPCWRRAAAADGVMADVFVSLQEDESLLSVSPLCWEDSSCSDPATPNPAPAPH